MWNDLLSKQEEIVLPWIGENVYSLNRKFQIDKKPREYGWYRFEISGNRKAKLIDSAEIPDDFEINRNVKTGYIVGDRFISDDACVDPDPSKFINQTRNLWLIENGLERFSRALVIEYNNELIYIRQEFPLGPEDDVRIAFQDKGSIDNIKDITPALDLAFQWEARERELYEKRIAEIEKLRRVEEENMRREELVKNAMKNSSTAVGRRELAKVDFRQAAKKALEMTNSELLDVRRYNDHEMVVQYRFRNRRFECVVEKNTMRVIDSGICLTDDYTGEKGDSYFMLESLPSVVGQAIDQGVLVVYRHV